MNKRDPKLTALQFNEYINNQNIKRLSSLMAEDFWVKVKKEEVWNRDMINGWKRFFKDWPTYKNIFTRVESRENLVILIGYALWSKDSKEEDHCIWTAIIENDLLSKWQIYEDTDENRQHLGLS
ncbi:MAG: hypothetical protein ACW986_03850 [Promethearchaeota archaeon]|jgi:hypothetical protein